MPPVFRNASREGMKWQVAHDLSENKFAAVYLDSPKSHLELHYESIHVQIVNGENTIFNIKINKLKGSQAQTLGHYWTKLIT